MINPSLTPAPVTFCVAAIFATMNRSATAMACVRALAEQTRPPDLVIIADNVSTDGTAQALENLTSLPFPLRVHRMSENRGNAGGIEEIMELALAEGMDAVWILDDDSWPRPDALQALLETPWDGQSVRHALQVDPSTQRFTWPLLLPDRERGTRLLWHTDDLPQDNFVESLASWTGALIPRAVCETVGPVMAELFIRGEDEDYPARISRAGFRFYACRGAVMDHPGPKDLVQWRFLGKSLFFEPGLADWKFYYKIRNMVWIKKKYESRTKALLMAAAYLAATLRFDGPRRLPLWLNAIQDGWQNHLGRWKNHP